MKIVLFFLIVFSVSSCTQYKWVKPGKNDLEMSKEYTSCHAMALENLPPDNKIFNSSSHGYSYEKKDKKGNGKWEKENYDVWIKNDIDDANSQYREVLIRNCMYSRGWDEIIISD
ncbi:hypothetical protein ACE38U_14625 [Cedecea sp. S5-13]|jgi:hypothetical protein|uniref:hypothetical protein n=1 Tax=Cedecea selenatireducens TaxID=3144416 RepID=UPI0035CCD198